MRKLGPYLVGALWKGLDFSLVVKLAVSLAAIWLVFKLGWGWNDLPEIRLAAPVWLLAAIGANFAILVLLSLRLRLVMSLVPDVQQPGLGWCIAVNWMGLGAAQIALGMISNDALRLAALTRRRYGLGAAASVIVADRAIGLLGLLLIGLGAMSVVIPGFWIALPILLMSLVFGLWCLAKLAVKGGRIGRALDLIAIIASNPRMLLAVPLAVLTHAQSVVVFYSVGRAVDIVPPVPETIVAVPAGLLAAALPISFGGWGTRELSVAGAYSLLDQPFDQAVMISILFGLITLAFSLPGLYIAVRLLRADSRTP